ncbi:MAG: SLC13 family permease [Pseudomonadota bacterium]
MFESRSLIGLFLGPALFLVTLLLPLPEGMTPEGMHVAAVAVLMAVWWITEAIPIPATALVPIAFYPLLGVMSGSEVTRAYANHLIYLFLGGFLIAVTMEKWNLHHRIALHTIRVVGMTPHRMVLGFMLVTAFLSMWISNTAATMMMVTIGAAVLHEMADEIEQVSGGIDTRPGHLCFGTALMLGIGYAASIGGIATLIGTPPNAILAGVVEKTYGYSISFLEWMSFGLPLSILMLVVTWLFLTRIVFRSELQQLPVGQDFIRQQIARLGPMAREEKYVAVVFVTVAASFAFMLPVATPPNAIVFSSRYVTIPQMVKAGIWLNLIGVVLITGFVYFVLPQVWGIKLNGITP